MIMMKLTRGHSHQLIRLVETTRVSLIMSASLRMYWEETLVVINNSDEDRSLEYLITQKTGDGDQMLG